MSSYDIFGKFYDAVMGDRAKAAQRLSRYIRNANPRAKSVLELGCGTGSVLKHLASRYDVSGVDLSSRMLAIAARKVPQAKLSRQDIVRFRLNKRFDVICCVFDTINHVLRFSDWRTLFSHVERHLVEDGCFIFDINTQRKLDRHIREPRLGSLVRKQSLDYEGHTWPKTFVRFYFDWLHFRNGQEWRHDLVSMCGGMVHAARSDAGVVDHLDRRTFQLVRPAGDAIDRLPQVVGDLGVRQSFRMFQNHVVHFALRFRDFRFYALVSGAGSICDHWLGGNKFWNSAYSSR